MIKILKIIFLLGRLLNLKPDYSFRNIRGSKSFGDRNEMTVGGGWYVGLPAHPTGHGTCL